MNTSGFDSFHPTFQSSPSILPSSASEPCGLERARLNGLPSSGARLRLNPSEMSSPVKGSLCGSVPSSTPATAPNRSWRMMRFFRLPRSYGINVAIKLVGSTEPFDPTELTTNKRVKDSTTGYTFFDPSAHEHIPFDEPIASFMQDRGNIVVMCRINRNDTIHNFVAVQYELLNRNARNWTSRWLHPENPDGGGQLYKVDGRAQYWRVQHIMEVIGTKVKVRYFGGHVDIIPRVHLHETMQPLADQLAEQYQHGDFRPV